MGWSAWYTALPISRNFWEVVTTIIITITNMDTNTNTSTSTPTSASTPTNTSTPTSMNTPPSQPQRKPPKPELDACVNRPKQWEFNGHFYFLSHTVPEYAGKRSDWLDARNLCRRHCMDSVSIETEAENEMVKQVVEREKLP